MGFRNQYLDALVETLEAPRIIAESIMFSPPLHDSGDFPQWLEKGLSIRKFPIDLTMRTVFSSDEKKDDKKNLAVLETLQEAAAYSSDNFFVYPIGERSDPRWSWTPN